MSVTPEKSANGGPKTLHGATNKRIYLTGVKEGYIAVKKIGDESKYQINVRKPLMEKGRNFPSRIPLKGEQTLIEGQKVEITRVEVVDEKSRMKKNRMKKTYSVRPLQK